MIDDDDITTEVNLLKEELETQMKNILEDIKSCDDPFSLFYHQFYNFLESYNIDIKSFLHYMELNFKNIILPSNILDDDLSMMEYIFRIMIISIALFSNTMPQIQ